LVLQDLLENQSLKQAFGIWACSLENYIITKPSCEVDGSHQKHATLMENAWHELQVMLDCDAHD